MKFRFEEDALVEYKDAAQYAEEHFGCGAQFVKAMRAALDSISEDPTRYQPIG